MYLTEGLSAKQIAERLDVSKAFVLERLHKEGIRKSKGRMTNPKNYRCNTPPYGWKVKDGKLVPNKSELKICRRVVALVRQARSYTSIAKELTNLGYKNRKGKVYWDHSSVINIFNRWKEKL